MMATELSKVENTFSHFLKNIVIWVIPILKRDCGMFKILTHFRKILYTIWRVKNWSKWSSFFILLRNIELKLLHRFNFPIRLFCFSIGNHLNCGFAQNTRWKVYLKLFKNNNHTNLAHKWTWDTSSLNASYVD